MEVRLQSQIDEKVAQIRALRAERSELIGSLQKVKELKSLLFDKGKPLERSILIALRILGFRAEGLQEADSEFDAVILDTESTRFIGEAEGKDDRAINVDKLDQLDRNLREDFARQDDATAQFAIGILFGNAFRLTAPEERQDFFTTKCRLAAKRSQIRLVRTTDLFAVAQYLDGSKNEQFAARCRLAIKDSPGEVVVFPKVPSGT